MIFLVQRKTENANSTGHEILGEHFEVKSASRRRDFSNVSPLMLILIW